MKNQVKVKETEVFQDTQGRHTVCEGKLILIKSKDVNKSNVYVNSIGYTSYIVSETEKILDEDTVLYKGEIITISKNRGHYLSSYDYTNIDVRADLCQKILVFPDNFSPKQLQAIVDEKILDEMKVLVECSVKWREEWDGNNHDGEPVIISDYTIKLNQQNHISIFPIVNNNDLSDRLFQLANDFAIAKEGDIAVMLHSIRNNYAR